MKRLPGGPGGGGGGVGWEELPTKSEFGSTKREYLRKILQNTAVSKIVFKPFYKRIFV